MQSTTDFSPDVILEPLRTRRGTIHVVRDDLLAGGTKQRAAIPYLLDRRAAGTREFVYASPFAGFAQVALAGAARHLDLPSVIFAAEVQPGRAHEFTELAAAHGARVELRRTLAEAEAAARRYADEKPDREKIPLGFDCDGFRTHLRTAIERQWRIVQASLARSPKVVWLPVGSGTLLKVFRSTLPTGTQIQGVNVNVLSPDDERLTCLPSDRVKLRRVPQPFEERALALPPVPSNSHYDAKLWTYLATEGADGDVWWNVAR